MNRVKELREERGLTQTDMATILLVSQATLSNWERGIHDPDTEALIALSKMFDCTIDYLLKNSDIRHPVADSEEIEKDQMIFRLMTSAKDAGLDPQDIELAFELVKRAKEKNINLRKQEGR